MDKYTKHRFFTALVLEIRTSLYSTPSDAIFIGKFSPLIFWNSQNRQNLTSEVYFLWEGKPKYTEKTSRSKDENQQQTQPTYMYGVDARIRNRAKLVGGECSQHCATPHQFVSSGAVHCFVAAAKVKFQTGQNLSVNLSVLTNRQNLSVVGLSVHVSWTVA